MYKDTISELVAAACRNPTAVRRHLDSTEKRLREQLRKAKDDGRIFFPSRAATKKALRAVKEARRRIRAAGCAAKAKGQGGR